MNIVFLMKPKFQTRFLYDHTPVTQALKEMRNSGFSAIPVINKDGTYMGIVSEGDFLRYVLDYGTPTGQSSQSHRVKDIMGDKTSAPVKITANLEDLLWSAVTQNFVPVVDDNDSFVGIITRRSIITYLSNRITDLQLDMNALQQESSSDEERK